MAPKNQRKASQNQNQLIPEPDILFEGKRLTRLLQSLRKQIEIHRISSKSTTTLPEKLLLKQQFAIGVNEVTRILERMPPSSSSESFEARNVSGPKLQAVIVAWDCNPRWLIKHLPNLAASRNVALIYVKDNKEGSLRLGEIVGLKTAIVVGIKVKRSCVNEFVRKIVDDDRDVLLDSVENC